MNTLQTLGLVLLVPLGCVILLGFSHLVFNIISDIEKNGLFNTKGAVYMSVSLAIISVILIIAGTNFDIKLITIF